MAFNRSGKRKLRNNVDANKTKLPNKRLLRDGNLQTATNYSIKDLLPEAILMEILSRLPLDSIKNVCHVFPSIVLRPEFERLYLQSTSSTLFVGFNRCTTQEEMFQYHHDTHQVVNTNFDLEDLFRQHNYQLSSTVNIVASCNGLLLGRAFYKIGAERDPITIESLCLVNPITRHNVIFTSGPITQFFGHLRNYGVGYSSSTRQYKVVCFGATNDVIKIFTIDQLGKNNNWRITASNSKHRLTLCNEFLQQHVGDLLERPVTFGGAIHWLVGNTNKILRFDIDDEDFDLLPIPHDLSFSRLSVVNGSLCALATTPLHLGLVEVWVMKEYGVKESWTRLTTIQNCEIGVALKVIKVLENGKLLIQVGAQLRTYDPIDGKWDKQKTLRLDINDRASITNFLPSFLALAPSTTDDTLQ